VRVLRSTYKSTNWRKAHTMLLIHNHLLNEINLYTNAMQQQSCSKPNGKFNAWLQGKFSDYVSCTEWNQRHILCHPFSANQTRMIETAGQISHHHVLGTLLHSVNNHTKLVSQPVLITQQCLHTSRNHDFNKLSTRMIIWLLMKLKCTYLFRHFAVWWNKLWTQNDKLFPERHK